jgi:hypothetical protein
VTLGMILPDHAAAWHTSLWEGSASASSRMERATRPALAPPSLERRQYSLAMPRQHHSLFAEVRPKDLKTRGPSDMTGHIGHDGPCFPNLARQWEGT